MSEKRLQERLDLALQVIHSYEKGLHKAGHSIDPTGVWSLTAERDALRDRLATARHPQPTD